MRCSTSGVRLVLRPIAICSLDDIAGKVTVAEELDGTLGEFIPGHRTLDTCE